MSNQPPSTTFMAEEQQQLVVDSTDHFDGGAVAQGGHVVDNSQPIVAMPITTILPNNSGWVPRRIGRPRNYGPPSTVVPIAHSPLIPTSVPPPPPPPPPPSLASLSLHSAGGGSASTSKGIDPAGKSIGRPPGYCNKLPVVQVSTVGASATPPTVAIPLLVDDVVTGKSTMTTIGPISTTTTTVVTTTIAPDDNFATPYAPVGPSFVAPIAPTAPAAGGDSAYTSKGPARKVTKSKGKNANKVQENSSWTRHIISARPGECIASIIMALSLELNHNVSIVSATGMISQAFLLDITTGKYATHEGQFQLQSLSGSLAICGEGGSQRSGGINVTLHTDGQIFTGLLVGELIASSLVEITYHSFPGDFLDEFILTSQTENALSSATHEEGVSSAAAFSTHDDEAREGV